ncbi:Receptor-like protein kinase [Quillaja saponaria]|uniref:non-specific serine/threonine protein kinase n=1 Tax=Quillaja saponaria TaxID=32244 RepID=A0AAD7KWK5_QUISA|nr:Receptor-like protein kinase [Quillaja saponaria]
MGHSLVNIEEISLFSNRLSGEIPKSISNASELVHLELNNNLFSGIIPNSLGNLKNLQSLKLDENIFTLEISFLSSISNCKQLRVMDLSKNPLRSKLPNSIGNFSSSLQKLFMSDCEITGSIPQGIGNLSGVIFLALDNNNFGGPIPTTMKELQNLQELFLEGNILNNSIPIEFCQMKNLGALILSNNQLYGLLPPCLGNLTSLRILYLDVNNLNSTIPSTLWSLEDILELNLSSNDFNGFLPQELKNLRALIQFDLSWNKISGNIPSAMGSLLTLEFLDLSYNALSGMIPKSMELLLDLNYLNVSYNRLQGEIPSGGPFVNFTAESFVMNDALCGRSNLIVPPCVIKKAYHRSPKKLTMLKFILPIIVLTTLLLTCLIIFRYKKKKHGDSAETELSTIGVPRRISYYELLQATNNFDESNFLGKGSFGSIFKGILSSGSSVAVKVFNFHLEDASRSFDLECEAMRNIRHRNLIKIISSCSNNVDFRALVMEFMPNGSLEKWLYAHNYCLDFLQRLNIMIDVASALEYLHNGSSTRLVHCDLKPSNVLLNEDMVAHVSDFGVAKLLDDGQSKTLTNTLATLGYIAPEYGSRGIVSIKGDVYSYGIMLMETFTRKKPTDDMFVGVLSMKSWVNESVPHATIQIMDSNLLSGEEQNITVKVLCMSSLMQLALNCCDDSPDERINMEAVSAALNKIKIKFMATIMGS